MIDVPEAAEFARGVRVGARDFDNAYQIVADREGNWSGSVTNPTSGLQTTIRFGRPFRECVVFIPPHREAICLEPYSGVANGFDLTARGVATGLRELQPGDSCSVRVEVEVNSGGSV
jgi:aldose 1-epimerase